MSKGHIVVDSSRAKLVWESPNYPTYWFPKSDVRADAAHLTTSDDPALADHVRVAWSAMDAWFEEEEEVFVHAHDPYKRIDILHSTRHVKVISNGVLIAESRRPTMLFETGARVRTYIPKLDVKMDLLTPSDKRTGCAYKGYARYWRLASGGEEVAWSYPFPIADCAKIAGQIAFYDERIEVVVD